MKKRSKFLTAAALIAVAAAVYCSCAVQTEEWHITSPRVPAACDGLRLTLLTDIHGAVFGQDNKALTDALRRSDPDILCISGDLVDHASDLSILEGLLPKLVEIAPTYFVTGNHEWRRGDAEALMDRIEACGVICLRNDYTVLEDGFVLAGADDPNGYADSEKPAALAERIRAEVGGDPYIAMLYHRNDSMEVWAPTKVDLVLAGHGHGGVIKVPGIGGLLGVDRRFFPDDAEGLYTQGRTTLAVSRGLGGIRLWNRPHLPTVVLHHGEP